MTHEEKIKFSEIINSYLGKKRICGVVDCNLMVLEMYEPEKFEKLKDRYTTIRGGARVARKEFGHRNMYEFLEAEYQKIDEEFVMPYDVILFDENATGIYTQHGIFSALPDGKFGFMPKDETTWDAYRKV